MNRLKKTAHLLIRQTCYPLILLSAFLVAACGNQNRYEDKMIFRYNESAGITSIDPAFSKDQPNIWACNQLFNGLVQMDEALNVRPCIARTWDIQDSGLTYRFHLRRDVFFHENPCFNGNPRKVTARDFEYSFQRLIQPETAAPGAWIFKNVDAFSALDDSTFEIRLKSPFSPFLGLLTMKYCSVLPHEAIEMYGNDFGRNPVGTGPFIFKVWYDNEKLVLLKNEAYFETEEGRTLPYLDAVAVSFIPDKQSAFLEFIKGNLDFLNSLDAGYKDDILTPTGELNPKYADRLVMEKLPFLNTEYLGLNMRSKHPALQNLQFRQALNYAFDRVEMMQFLRNNIGTPARSGVLPKGLPAYQPSPEWGYHYNPERARILIKESGLNLDQLPPLELTTTANYRDLCEYFQGALSKVGIPIEVNVVPASHLRELKANGECDFFRASWIADYPDGENYFSMFYSGNHTPMGPNYTFFEHPQFDEWYLNSRLVDEPLEKKEMYTKSDSLLMYHSPIVPLYYDEVVRFYPKTLEGMKGNALNVLDLKRVRKNQSD